MKRPMNKKAVRVGELRKGEMLIIKNFRFKMYILMAKMIMARIACRLKSRSNSP